MHAYAGCNAIRRIMTLKATTAEAGTAEARAAGDSGWTWVTRKRRHNRGRQQPGRVRHLPAPGPDPDAVHPSGPRLALDDLRRYHDRVADEWRRSDCWAALQHHVETALSSGTSPRITKAVCLGPGSFELGDAASASPARRRTAHLQTEAFRALVRLIDSHQGGQPISCIIQEPRFSPIDKDLCCSLGMRIADTPDAFSLIDSSTLAFGVHLELCVWHEALAVRGRLPAIFIGTGLDEWEEVVLRHEERHLLAPMAEMEASFVKYPFLDLDYVFFSTCMYWRQVAAP